MNSGHLGYDVTGFLGSEDGGQVVRSFELENTINAYIER